MNQRYRKEDGLDLAMFGLGPFIGKYGWVIADYSFKLMSWSLLVGTVEVFYEKTAFLFFGGHTMWVRGFFS